MSKNEDDKTNYWDYSPDIIIRDTLTTVISSRAKNVLGGYRSRARFTLLPLSTSQNKQVEYRDHVAITLKARLSGLVFFMFFSLYFSYGYCWLLRQACLYVLFGFQYIFMTIIRF
ncbi:hypothetical protein C0081_09180 [Cohaesibacter celericrescens]|uniref:Uncharacterized protein n=1 Tax=Cohaesibacter celericrescens TaxID=2067669 RepID=A0A2N5XSK0_9HYPH|nr:hypothetical protein C0081_09180 [Cohaesibacter celericrescens]